MNKEKYKILIGLNIKDKLIKDKISKIALILRKNKQNVKAKCALILKINSKKKKYSKNCFKIKEKKCNISFQYL